MCKISKLKDIILSIMIIIILISKGGFYKSEIVFPDLVICVVGIICVIYSLILNILGRGNENNVCSNINIVKHNTMLSITLLDISVILLPIAYVLPIILKKAVSIESAIAEAIGYCVFSVIYFLTKNTKFKDIFINLGIILGIIIAIFGLDEISYRFMENTKFISYLGRNESVISSVIQYANISGIIMYMSFCFLLFKFKSKEKLNNFKFALHSIEILLLCTSIYLTTSRMVVAILILTCILNLFISNNKKHAWYVFVLNILSVIIAGLQTNFVKEQIYYANFLVYIATFILIYLALIFKNYINQTMFFKNIFTRYFNSISAKTKYILYAIILFIGIFGVAMLFMPNSLKIMADIEPVYMYRRTDKFNIGENTLDIQISNLNSIEDIKYTIQITQIYDTFKEEKILEINSEELENIYNISTKFDVTNENIKELMFSFNIEKGEVAIDSLKINGKNIVMSYAFIPDKIIFRYKDSSVLDLSNTLRFRYYADALELFSLSKIVGLGGEGFKMCYQMVQDTPYISSEVHSSPLQILVESGIIGGISYILLNIMLVIITYKLCKNNTKYIYFMYVILAFNVMSIFDLNMSFSIYQYVFAIVAGIIVNEYIGTTNTVKQNLNIKDVSPLLTVVKYCFYIMCLAIAISYNFKIYSASCIKLTSVENVTEDEYESKICERIAGLEKKLELDKYNSSYMSELDAYYTKYIDILKEKQINITTYGDSQSVSDTLAKYMLRQKANIDNMIICEYYNKYLIEKVASCYFKNYYRYAEYFEENFESRDVAYAFYLNYALKLTQRLKQIAPLNEVANGFYNNIFETYLENLKLQNKYLQSNSVSSIIQQMEEIQNNE